MIYHGDALEYIEETPAMLRRIWTSEEAITKACMERLKGKSVTELYLIGSGSSHYAAMTAAPNLQKMLGVRVYAITPAEFQLHKDFINLICNDLSQEVN